MADRWTPETVGLISMKICGAGVVTAADACAVAALDALADAGLLAEPGTTGDAEAWRHNAKLHNDMRRRIQRVATHAAAEQRSLAWVADELTDILDDPQAWRGETTWEVVDDHS